MAEKAYLCDASKCMGCRGCQVACKQWNDLPGERTRFFAGDSYQNPETLSPTTWSLVKFYEKFDNGKMTWRFRKEQCKHCADATCLAACPVEPVKAMTRDEETGVIYVNEELCIGCGACEEYCPFGVPSVDGETEKSKKCNMCLDRIKDGMQPLCVKTCPNGALVFGDRDDVIKEAQKRAEILKKKGYNPYIYGMKELKGLGTIYLLPEGLDFYKDLPKNPQVPDDLGLLHNMLKKLSPATLTAAAVGLAIGYLKTVRADEVKKVEKL